MRRSIVALIPVVLSVGILLACGHEATAPRPHAGMTVVAGASASDTILASLPNPLVVEVRDSSGALAVGMVVRFQAITAPRPPYATVGVISPQVQDLTSNQFGSFAAPATDAKGHASVFVKLASTAGTNQIQVSVPLLGVTDTVTFTATPGAAAAFRFTSRDTGVTVGGTTQLHASVVDRFGNARSDPVTFETVGTFASVSSTGLASGATVGRQVVRGHAGASVDSVNVSVVPPGVIAAYASYLTTFGDSIGIVTMNLDGGGFHWLTRLSRTDQAAPAPSWTPAGSVVYADGPATGAGNFRLYTVAAGSTPTLVLPSGAPGVNNEEWPRYSANGTLLSFSSGDPNFGGWHLFARRADGTVSPLHAQGPVSVEWRGSPSPDGSRVAYVGGEPAGAMIRVLDVATGIPSTWAVQGQVPRWSPTGDRIAFVAERGGPIKIVNADGSGLQTVTSGNYLESIIDWSPDGRWLIAKAYAGSLDLIEVATGTVIPMPYLSRFASPAWKP